MKKNYLSPETCKIIRGLMALLIMFHHLSREVYYGKIPNAILIQIGVIGTAIFFFYSGYGLLLSYKNKPNYLDGFLMKRLPAVLIPYLIATGIYCLYLCIIGQASTIGKIILKLRKGITLLPNSWFIISLLFMYIFFYFGFKFTKDIRNGIVVCSILVLVYAVLLCYFNFGHHWYVNAFVFIFGLIYAKYYDFFDEIITKHKFIILVVCFILFVLNTLAGNKLSNPYIILIIKSFRSIVVCEIILVFSSFISGSKRVLSMLGTVSFEFYMYHGILINVFKSLSDNVAVYTLIILLLNCVISYIMNKVDTKLVVGFAKCRKA